MSYAAFGLPDPAQCAQWDRLAATRVPLIRLMENAGRAVARAIVARLSPMRVLVLCGAGNNGGDGYVVARHLARRGWPVACAALAEPAVDTPAGVARAAWHGTMVPFAPQEAARAALVVDAVFGAGLSRDVESVVSDVLRQARRVVAIDMPSGVDGATGAARGVVKQAELTVTFTRPKPGHLLLPGRDLCGVLVVADIGMPAGLMAEIGLDTWHNAPGLWCIPSTHVQSHKYSRGVVSVCGGAVMPGATRLAASGAQAAGAGLVRIWSERAAAQAYRLGAPGLIVDDGPFVDMMVDPRRVVWLCGPGLTTDEVDETLPILLQAGKTIVADAGALAWAGDDADRLRGVCAVTPHAGEFARLFGVVGEDKPGAARRAAVRLGGVVVLKGPDTVIASPDGRCAINDHASAALATAGSGDTLAGVIAALLAGGMAPWEACCAAVWMHGEAGLQAGDWSIAEDLAQHLGAARARAIARSSVLEGLRGV